MYDISIIIPIYNVESYIEECLESVIVQLTNSIQIICINDGTPDSSMDIAQDIVSKYGQAIQEQFIFINQENQGLSVARNVGLDVAIGKYITFLDSDDKLEPNYFSTILEILQKEDDYDIIDFNLITSEGKIIKTRNDDFDSVFFSMKWFCPARIFKNQLISKYRFTPGIYYEDLDLTPKLYIESSKTFYINLPLYWYRKNDESITRLFNHQANLKTIDSLEKIFDDYFSLYSREQNYYYALLVIQSYFLLCVSACRRFGIEESFMYIKKHQRNVSLIDIGNLLIDKKRLDPKILYFYSYPRAYISFYSIYLLCRENVS